MIDYQLLSENSSLSLVISSLAPIARLTNGISIQTELSADPSKMNDVVGELLGVRSGEEIGELKELKIDELRGMLNDYHAASIRSQRFNNSEELRRVMGKLEAMKPVLLKQKPNDIKAMLSSAASNPGADILLLEPWNTVTEILEKVQGGGNFGPLDSLKVNIQSIDKKIRQLSSYQSDFKGLLNLTNLDLDRANDIAREFAIYQSDAFTSLHDHLLAVKKDAMDLSVVLSKNDALGSLITVINSTISLITGFSQKSLLPKRLTAGFPKGITDVSVFLDELNGRDLPFAKDFRNLLLKPFSDFRSRFPDVGDWKVVSSGSNALKQAHGLLATAFAKGKLVLEHRNLSESLEKVADCVKDLKAPTTKTFDVNVFQNIQKQVAELKENVLVFKKSMSEAYQLCSKELPSKLKYLQDKLNAKDTKNLWNELRSWEDLPATIEIFGKIQKALKASADKSPFDKLSINVDEISKVLISFTDTGVPEALECLQKITYNTDGFINVIRFGADIIAIRSSINNLEALLMSISKVKKAILSLDTVFKKVPKIRRRELQSSVSRDLGYGVQALVEYVKILNFKKHVKVAVNANDRLKAAVDAIPGAKRVWTNDNRKLMGEMITDLEALDKKMESIMITNISTLWMAFDEAGKVKGLRIDAKVFADPIATSLGSFRNSKYIRKSKTDFQALGALNLNFSQHHANLKAAFLTMDPLQQFFFGNNLPLVEPVVMTTTEK